jgi:hypothetical protein
VSCHIPGVRSGHAKRSRSGLAAGLLVKHTCFQRFSIGNLDWNAGVHVPNQANLERETGSNAKSNPFLGRWNVGGRGLRSNPKKRIGHMIWKARWRCSFRLIFQSISTAGPNLIKSNPKCPVGNFQSPESKPCFWLDSTRIQSKTPNFGWIRLVLNPDPTAFYDKQCIKS